MERIIGVNFINGDEISPHVYFYKTDMEDLKTDNIVVVHTLDTLALARVAGPVCNKHLPIKPTKWIVSKVDLDAHFARLDKIAEIKKARDVRRLELEKSIEDMLRTDVVLRTLNKELKELGAE